MGGVTPRWGAQCHCSGGADGMNVVQKMRWFWEKKPQGFCFVLGFFLSGNESNIELNKSKIMHD